MQNAVLCHLVDVTKKEKGEYKNLKDVAWVCVPRAGDILFFDQCGDGQHITPVSWKVVSVEFYVSGYDSPFHQQVTINLKPI